MAASAPDTGWWAHLWPCYSCCQQIWIPSLGQFSSQCLGVVSHIPLWVAMTTVVLRYGVGPILHCYRPVWLRRFTAEQDALPVADVDQEAGDQSPPLKVVWTSWNRCLLLLGMVIAALGAIGAAIWPEHAEVYLTPVLPSFVSSLMVVVERPRTTPGSVFIINSATTIVELLILTVLPSAVPNGWPQAIAWIAGVFLPLLSVILMLNMPMRDPLLDSSNISRPFTQPSPDVRSPEDAVTLWQWMTVSWMAPLMKVGYERQLHDEDVWLLPYDFHHSRLHSLFREVSGTVFTRLLKANGLDLVITTTLAVLETSIELVGPILLKQLLAALTAEQPNVRAAIVYAGITLVSRLVQAQSGVFSLWFQRRAYERSRGELITMIHEKTLRRKAFTFSSGQEAPEGAAEQEQGSGSKTTSGSATLADDGSGNKVDADPDSLRSRFQQFKSMVSFNYSKPNPPKPEPIPASPSPEQTPASTGKILNLLRNDAYEIAQRFWESPNIVTKPLSFLVSLVLVWRILGPASLSGILVLLTCMAINALLMRLMLHIEQVRREITDNKLQRTSQFVESIRHLRWYDWQDAWLSKIMESRKDELIRRVQSNVVLKGISAVNNLGAYLFPVAGFWAYTLVEGRPLTVDVAFPALNLFTMLQDSLRELPNLVTVLLNAKVSMDRIEAFMLEPEKEGLDRDLAFGEGEGPPGELEIIFRNASFSWPGSAKEVLRDVSIACRLGLTLVCGKVGIGKTALLQAILGELDQHGGERIVPSEVIGYCAQTPWLESMSIRENILFSAVYDKARFEKVIDACCLRDDLDQFRAKDLTLIGENGVGLSGGQRARVALARAIYSQARVLLLDDPIAALDHHTATSLLANLFSDKNSPLTAGRLIIFVTHRVDIVTPYAYQVIEIVDGGRAETFDGKELENNEEELEHLAEIANTAPPPPDTEEDEPVADKFIEEERRVHGGVLASVYWQYIKAGRLGWWSFMIGGFILFRTVRIAYFWFLKEWGEQYQDPPSGIYSLHAGMGDYAETSQHVVISQSIFHISGASTNGTWLDLGRYLPAPDKDVRPWLVWFLVLSVSQVLASALSDAALVVVMYQAGKNLFAQAMSRVTNATFRFYDVTPVGRLMNRLTSDMGTVDGQIAGQLTTVAWYTIGWLSAVAVISSATPLFLVISVTMTALFVLTFNWFLPTSQSLRRLETVSLSPLMSNFGTLVEGLTTVRAYRAEPHFQNRIIATTDAFQKMDHFYWSLQAWLQYRFDILSALTTFILTLCAILTGLSSGTVGFVLASAANFVRSTHSLCRKYGELQMQFVSVERIVELLSLEQEPRGGFLPPAAWPGYGDDIVFDNVTLRYAPQLETVLHNVSFTIPGGANVAVTGRTASGKSTLALALLGTLHPDPDTDGSIRIGAVDLLDVDKHTLRRNITFVAQDPVLFPGTLRDNLDPLGERDETERAEVLERVLGRSGSFTLDSRVDGGGKNLSQGQRQLVGLGRAMLRRSPVVIMDEATASIDAETAAYIQRLLREELRYSTVITIAHKAEAVEDADWEVVLDKGRVVRAGPRGRRRA